MHLPQRSPKNIDSDSHYFASLGLVLPVFLESQGSALGVIGVSFPKTFKTRNRKVSGNSVRYSCTVKYLWLGSVSARAILKLSLKYTLLWIAMIRSMKHFLCRRILGPKLWIVIKAPMNNELWIFRSTRWAQLWNLLADTMNNVLWTVNMVLKVLMTE